jgi:hypothetical protein
MTPRIPSAFKFIPQALLGLMVVALSGCGGEPAGKPTGSAAITVTFGGQPVTEGLVSLQNKSGEGGGAPLNSTGTASIPNVVQGDYVVTVTPPVVGVAAPDPGKPKLTVKNFDNIPEKFRRTETSTLKATIKAGNNELKFDLQK